MTDTRTKGLTLDPTVIARIKQVTEYVGHMRNERAGWGPEAERDVTDTMYSWCRALDNLMGAKRVWLEGISRPLDSGRPELSFGGDVTGTGFYFGILSRLRVSHSLDADRQPREWQYPAIEWTWHS